MKDSVLSDIHVRKAISYAIHRENLIKDVLDGYGIPARGPMGIDSEYSDPEVHPIPFRPRVIRESLKEGGWRYNEYKSCYQKDGKCMELTIDTYEDNPFYSRVAMALDKYFLQLGVRTNIRYLPCDTMQNKLMGNTPFQCILTEFRGACRNVDYMRRIWCPSGDGPSAAGAFEDAQVTSYFKEAAEAEDPEEKKFLYQEIDMRISSLHPGAFLFHKTTLDAMSKRFDLSGEPFGTDFMGLYNIGKARKARY